MNNQILKTVSIGGAEYFDQLSLAAVASFSSGIIATNTNIVDLLLTLLIVRTGLLLFYRIKTPNIDGEIRLLIVSSIGWLIGKAITDGHTWNTNDNLVANPSSRSFLQPKASKTNPFISALLTILQKIL